MKDIPAFAIGLIVGALIHYSVTPDYSLATTKAAIAAKADGLVHNEDHKHRGQQLLAALRNASPSGSDRRNHIDATNIVLTYIPAGSTFEDAQAILHYAGIECTLIDRPPKPPFIVGTAPLSKDLFSSAEVVIDLYPKLSGNFDSNLGTVHAGILLSEL